MLYRKHFETSIQDSARNISIIMIMGKQSNYFKYSKAMSLSETPITFLSLNEVKKIVFNFCPSFLKYFYVERKKMYVL